MDKNIIICPICNSCPKQKHFNSKYCLICAKKILKRPIGKLTKSQELRLHQLRIKYNSKEIANRIGTSRSNLIRWCRDRKISLAHKSGSRKYILDPILRQNVLDYYVENGKIKTQKKFPNIKVRSIIERYPHAPRQIRWKYNEILEAVRMGGLVPKSSQAIFFNRPNANEGSINSIWNKKLNGNRSVINGLPYFIAKRIVKDKSRFINLKYRKLFLWIDLENNLSPNLPIHFKKAIKAMAKFQKWLFNDKEPRKKILNMIKKRTDLNGK